MKSLVYIGLFTTLFNLSVHAQDKAQPLNINDIKISTLNCIAVNPNGSLDESKKLTIDEGSLDKFEERLSLLSKSSITPGVLSGENSAEEFGAVFSGGGLTGRITDESFQLTLRGQGYFKANSALKAAFKPYQDKETNYAISMMADRLAKSGSKITDEQIQKIKQDIATNYHFQPVGLSVGIFGQANDKEFDSALVRYFVTVEMLKRQISSAEVTKESIEEIGKPLLEKASTEISQKIPYARVLVMLSGKYPKLENGQIFVGQIDDLYVCQGGVTGSVYFLAYLDSRPKNVEFQAAPRI